MPDTRIKTKAKSTPKATRTAPARVRGRAASLGSQRSGTSRLRATVRTSAQAVPFAQVRRSTLREACYAGLREGLLSGRFGPGDRLTVRELAEWLGSGTMPVRDAVVRLVAEGALVGRSTGRIHVPRLTRAEFEDFVELRFALESLATTKAVESSRAPALAANLRQALRDLDRRIETGDVAGALAANFRFHFLIYRAAGSDLIATHIESLWLRAGPMMSNLVSSPAARANWRRFGAPRHQRLCEAVAAADAAAASRRMASVIRAAADWQRKTFAFETA